VARCRRSGMTRGEFGPTGVLDRVAVAKPVKPFCDIIHSYLT
jgi:hypothetical protein